MDFIKLLSSLDELLYEVMSWLAFYPRTLVRILRHPVAVAQYTRLQMQQPKEQQFAEAISPPLLLILSILLAHVLELICAVPLPDQTTRLATLLMGNEEGLLAFRSVSFSLYALLASWWVLKRTDTRIDRDTLREPFFIQSFLTSPFAVIGSIASIMCRSQAPWGVACGLAIGVAITLWYVLAQASVYRHMTGGGMGRSLLFASTVFLLTSALLLVGSYLIMVGLTLAPFQVSS